MPMLKQATVAGDGKPIQGLDIVRRRAVQQSQPADIGSFIPGEVNPVNYDISYGITTWMDLRNGQQGSQVLSLLSEAKMPWIFQHWGGISCNGLANAIHLAERFRIHGIAVTREDYSDPATANFNVTTIHSGGMTVPNNGTRVIYAGDTVLALPPHIRDPMVVGALNAAGIPNRGRTTQQDGAQHARYTPLPPFTSYSMLAAAMGQLASDDALRTQPLQSQYDLSINEGGINPAAGAQDPLSMLGAELRLFAMTVAARAVEALYVRGHVQLRTAPVGGGAFDFEGAAEARARGGLPAPTTRSAAQPYDLLGFGPASPAGGFVTPAATALLRDELVDAIFFGLDGGSAPVSVAGAAPLQAGAHPALAPDVRAAVRNPLQRLANAFDRLGNAVRNVTVGKALTAAAPGGEFHLAVGGAPM